MREERYNGWTNYETWLVSLWADNDEATYRHRQRLAQEIWDSSQPDRIFTRDERATLELAESLLNETEMANPLAEDANLWADLIGAALAEVNWHEIAEHLIQDVEKCLQTPDKHDNEGS